MELLSRFVQNLKDPHLVIRFQNYFGVHSPSGTKATRGKIIKKATLDKDLDSESLTLNHLKRRRLKKDHVEEDKTHLSTGDSSLHSTSNVEANGKLKGEDTFSSESDVETLPYIVTNSFWYYFFLFGTYLGDEVFYATFIPFWFWNIDGAVGRRIVMVWTIIMYIGQGIKDVVCWPRPPSPPVFRLQKKWSLEHGMPSTHAMVGIAIPFSVVIYTVNRYQYNVGLGVAVAICWCAVISLSRIYLGMHSVLDVVVGLVLAVILMIPVIPLVDWLDGLLLTSKWSPVLLIATTVPMIVFYPTTTFWTPTRGDTTTIVSFCVGTYIGAWTNYHLGVMSPPPRPPPYTVIWPSWPMFGTGTLRTVIGLCSIVATIAVCKSAQHAMMRCVVRGDISESAQQRTQQSVVRNTVELTCKYLSYITIGFNVLYLMPNVFKMLSIERPTFYTEM